MKTLLVFLFFVSLNIWCVAQNPSRYLVTCSRFEGKAILTGFLFNEYEITKFTSSTDTTRYQVNNIVYLKDKGQYQYRLKDYDETRNKIIFHPESGSVLIQIAFSLFSYSGCIKE